MNHDARPTLPTLPTLPNTAAAGALAALTAISRYTLLEAVRGRVPAIMLAIIVAAFGFAAFLRQVAMIEGAAIQLAIIAALVRLCAVFILMSFVIASVVRESADKGVELALAHPLPRWQYVLGRFLGFAAVGLAIAIAAAVPLAPFAPPGALGAWVLSLACELMLIAAAAFFFTLTLTHYVAAFAAVASFYALARSIDALLVIARAAEQSLAWTDRLANGLIGAVAAVLPHLDRFTVASWLTDGVPAGALAAVLTQSAIYIVLLLAAALFDFYRQNF